LTEALEKGVLFGAEYTNEGRRDGLAQGVDIDNSIGAIEQERFILGVRSLA